MLGLLWDVRFAVETGGWRLLVSKSSQNMLLARRSSIQSLQRLAYYCTISAAQTTSTPEKKSESQTKRAFLKLGLSQELASAVESFGFKRPTKIQSLAIPTLLKRVQSTLMAAETGSGKTLAYLLPLVQLMKEDEKSEVYLRERRPRSLILVPTRELAFQVLDVAKRLSHYVRFRSVGISGGSTKSTQHRTLDGYVDMLVATPGRMLQHREEKKVLFTDVRYVVVDEADTMFESNFGDDLKKLLLPIHGLTASRKDPLQTPPLFTFVGATFTANSLSMIEQQFPGIEKIVSPSLHRTLPRLRQSFVAIANGQDKQKELLKVLQKMPNAKKTLVFCNTVASCRSTEHFLRESGMRTFCYHGEMPPKLREQAYEAFLATDGAILVCTDIAARGLDMSAGVDHVVQFDFAFSEVEYLHRVGRTARAGAEGHATSLYTSKEAALATAIQRALKQGATVAVVAPALRVQKTTPSPTRSQRGSA